MMLLILTDDTTEVIERSIVCPITKAEFINLQQAPTSINTYHDKQKFLYYTGFYMKVLRYTMVNDVCM